MCQHLWPTCQSGTEKTKSQQPSHEFRCCLQRRTKTVQEWTEKSIVPRKKTGQADNKITQWALVKCGIFSDSEPVLFGDTEAVEAF